MKIKDWEQTKAYLTKPSRKVLEEKVRKELDLPKGTKVEGHKILSWINYNNKVHGNNKMPITDEEKKVAAEIEAGMNPYKYESKLDKLVKTDKYGNEETARSRIELKDKIEKDFFQNKLKNLRKVPVKIVKKPTVQDWLSFEDYLSVIDPNWMDEEPNNKPKPDDTRLKKKIREGIRTII